MNARTTTTTTIEWVEDAVRHHPLHTRAGFWQGVFAHWFSSFIYNQIWEDPRVDALALDLGPESRVLTISSGGCNALHYLLSDPAAITVIDLNVAHLSLLRLKLAALRGLPGPADFYAFFGAANDRANRERYQRWIQPQLDAATREFWEGRNAWQRALFGSRLDYFERGLYNHSHLGVLLRLIHTMTRVCGRDIGSIVKAQSLAEQRRIFESEMAPLLDGALFRFLSKLPFALFSLGIPPQQRAALQAEEGGDLAAVLRGRVERLACELPIADNYFAWQGFVRSYDHAGRKAVPEYLQARNFDVLRQRVGRVETRQCGLQECLAGAKTGDFNAFVFLDAQDWMPDPELATLWTEVVRVGAPGSRIIFRTAGSHSPLDRALPPSLRERLFFHETESRRLHSQDRSAIYGGFFLYEILP